MSSSWVSPPELTGPVELSRSGETVAWYKPPTVPLLPDSALGTGLSLVERLGVGPAGRTVPQLENDASGVVLTNLAPDAIRLLECDAAAPNAAERRFVGVFEPSDAIPSRIEGSGAGRPTGATLRTLERGPGGDLVEVTLTRGRAGGLRGLLSERGLRLVGADGGEPAYRMMWQLRSIAVGSHRFEAALDEDLVHCARGTRRRLGRRLERAIVRREPLYRAEAETDAFRVLNGAADDTPGIELDRYGDYALIHLRDDEVVDDPAEVCDWVAARGAIGIYVVRRAKDASSLTDADRGRRAPAAPIRGVAAPTPLLVRENGIGYRARLGDGLSTGIFLDQRENRRRISREAKGGRVLNLFGYTGAFAVAAASGGATATVTVDLARSGLERAEEALAPYGPAHRTVRADVFDFLGRSPGDFGGPFDWIVCDPPTFARSGSGRRWRSGRDWVGLGERILPWLAAGGRLLVCSNDRRMAPSAFRDRWREVAKSGRRSFRLVAHRPPIDFPSLSGADPHLKTLEIASPLPPRT